jgi:hypothetical protein
MDMRWIAWLFVALMGFLTIGMISAGFAIPAIIAIASVALVLPPLWDHIKTTSPNTRPMLRGFFSGLLAFSALGSWGSHYADTPEGKAALQAQELACCRFDGHRDKVFYRTGGPTWNEGSLRESSSLRR